MAPLTILAVTTAVPGQEKVLRAAQETLVAETRGKPGCLRYELHQSLDDPRVLAFLESWAGEAEWRAHMQGEAMQRFQAGGAGRLIQDFVLHRMRQVA